MSIMNVLTTDAKKRDRSHIEHNNTVVDNLDDAHVTSSGPVGLSSIRTKNEGGKHGGSGGNNENYSQFSSRSPSIVGGMPLSMKRQRLEMAGIYHQLPPPKRIYYYKGIKDRKSVV